MAKGKEFPKQSRLSDLYKKGQRLAFDDPDEPNIAVWVQKLSSNDMREAMRGANAARARFNALRSPVRQDKQEEREAFIAEAEMDGMTFDRDSLITFLAAHASAEKRKSHESRIAEEERWSKDGYLDGLLASWSDPEGEMLQDRWLIDNDDPEASAVHAALNEFLREVEEAVEEDIEEFRKANIEVSDEDLLNEVVDILVSAEADNAWFDEWQKQQVFYATREISDHRKKYFESRAELDECDMKVLTKIWETIDAINVPSLEGKD